MPNSVVPSLARLLMVPPTVLDQDDEHPMSITPMELQRVLADHAARGVPWEYTAQRIQGLTQAAAEAPKRAYKEAKIGFEYRQKQREQLLGIAAKNDPTGGLVSQLSATFEQGVQSDKERLSMLKLLADGVPEADVVVNGRDMMGNEIKDAKREEGDGGVEMRTASVPTTAQARDGFLGTLGVGADRAAPGGSTPNSAAPNSPPLTITVGGNSRPTTAAADTERNCGPTMHWDGEKCVANSTSSNPPTTNPGTGQCPPGYSKDMWNNCVPASSGNPPPGGGIYIGGPNPSPPVIPNPLPPTFQSGQQGIDLSDLRRPSSPFELYMANRGSHDHPTSYGD